MKKLFTVFSLLVILALVITACGSKATPTPEPTKAPVAAAEPTKAPAAPEAHQGP